ncbi:alpha-hydroxy acid oxidase [Polynucleobacter sinensis]|uniref:alpha-hydroxy acid oxidase n=1 Tax=Polynucleobacter sinensis TaxID=1743157 RepID=UPI000780D37A|nr:alpha-hydroxy acid oxidase [Polynucleobacter sinensis]
MRITDALSIADLRLLAKKCLPASIFGYIDGGSEDQATVLANRRAFLRWSFLTRPLVNVENRDLCTEIFDEKFKLPFGISPMGVSSLCSFEGDLALAAAAKNVGAPFILSAASTVPLERVVKLTPNVWCQAYLPANFDVISPYLERLQKAKVKVLVVTIDVQLASTRENELRNGFSLPLRPNLRLFIGGILRPGWITRVFLKTLLLNGVPHFENFTAERGGPIINAVKGDHRSGRAAMTWEEVARIRKEWPGRLVLKGILRAEDAFRAEQIGVDGIIVSNHGGRQLDGAVSSLDALPAIVKAVPNLTVMLDGGIRRGTDVLKALALGAKCVFIGRPAMYGLGAGGEKGVLQALNIIKNEVDVDLALLGCAAISSLDQSYLTPSN